MIRVPNTSPLLILDRLDLLGPPELLVVTRPWSVSCSTSRTSQRRGSGWAHTVGPFVDAIVSERVDPGGNLGAGERSVLAVAVVALEPVLCILDDAAARAEARRLGVLFTGTLGLILRARLEGTLDAAAPLIEDAIEAGLYLDDGVIASALARVGERWPH